MKRPLLFLWMLRRILGDFSMAKTRLDSLKENQRPVADPRHWNEETHRWRAL